jgi:hypothetical protein
MALSPIQIFQQQQNPLAQILAGGNQAVTGIFDRAIQIGRDMSNKQLQQEQDMMAMRKFETSMMERRAENLQQNNEDAIRFARGAFESDRKFGVDQAQQSFQNNRATAQDLFSNTMQENRYELAVNADQRAEEDQKLQVEAVKAERAARAAEQEQIKGIFGGATTSGQSSNIEDATNVSGMYQEKTASITAQPRLSLSQIYTIKNSKTATPAQLGEAEAALAKHKAQQKQSTPGKVPDPTRQAINELTLEEKQAKADKEFGTGYVDSNPTAFVPSAGRYEDELYQLAAAKGVKPEDALYSKDFPEEKRKAIVEAQKIGQFGIEKAAIDRIDDIEQYVRLGGLRLSEADKETRRKLYRRLKGQTAPQAEAAPAAIPTTAESLLDSYMK